MWTKRKLLLIDRISSEIEAVSDEAGKKYKCPKCGKVLYEENFSDRCPDCLMPLKGNTQLLVFQERTYGLFARIIFTIILLVNAIPFALVVPSPRLELKIAYLGCLSAMLSDWTLFINPLYLNYEYIDEKEFTKRDLAGGKRRCVVYFILRGIVFLFLSQLLRIRRSLAILSFALLIIAFVISYIDIVFPHITKYEPLYFRYLLKTAVNPNIYHSNMIWILIGGSITLIANIVWHYLV